MLQKPLQNLPRSPEELPCPVVILRAGAPIASWEEVIPVGSSPSKWLSLFVTRVVSVPDWLRGAAALVLIQRAQLGDLEDDPSFDSLDRKLLPRTLERAEEVVQRLERVVHGRLVKTAWETIVEDFVSYQRRRKELRLPPLPVFSD